VVRLLRVYLCSFFVPSLDHVPKTLTTDGTPLSHDLPVVLFSRFSSVANVFPPTPGFSFPRVGFLFSAGGNACCVFVFCAPVVFPFLPPPSPRRTVFLPFGDRENTSSPWCLPRFWSRLSPSASPTLSSLTQNVFTWDSSFPFRKSWSALLYTPFSIVLLPPSNYVP